ncbi:helix-turn-helix domain-containing protein [Streptomyces olivochromogenes]|uniref:helix-turn-helix domain-containing protein n=1 Tax=Streptomyces olivochromogenes TaxID=1963 RepID=UPI001F3ED32E|nr:helix-turn-helix transcriptional regulator [Streptomyces olivochromogenes]
MACAWRSTGSDAVPGVVRLHSILTSACAHPHISRAPERCSGRGEAHSRGAPTYEERCRAHRGIRRLGRGRDARAATTSTARGGGKTKLAEDAGVHRAAITRLLQRQSMPDLDTMRGLARALGVPVRDVLIRSGKLTEEDLPQAPAPPRPYRRPPGAPRFPPSRRRRPWVSRNTSGRRSSRSPSNCGWGAPGVSGETGVDEQARS